MRFAPLLLLALLGACAPAVSHAPAPSPAAAEVVVLATLHQLHAQVPGYSFEDLSRTIEHLRPDVLAVELTPADLASRRDQQTKQEYPKSIFPLLEKHPDWRAVALEPAEPEFSRLVGLFREAGTVLRAEHPEKAEAFGTYQDALYGMLFERWTSPESVNSPETDALMESKHRFQEALFGEKEVQAWEGWNQHFLEVILRAARENPGRRIVVLVGAEHGYWLRGHLAKEPGVRLGGIEK
jgi:hypothetical protein